jgi:phosphoglycolate phosphatase
MGIGSRPILETLAEMSAEQREAAEEVLHRHEDHAAEHSTLNDGCIELLNWIAARGWRTAIITRNRLKSAQTVLDRHAIRVDVLLTRDDGLFKPDPASLWLACRRLEVLPAESWMVGDGSHDIEAGIAAGIRTVWISHDQPKSFAAEPWRSVVGLVELHEMLREIVE